MSYLGQEIPKLGYGFMRLPMKGEDVDIEKLTPMVDLFLERGFSYFDTSYSYIKGKSEEAFKTTVVDRYPRDSYIFCTKMPAWAGPKTAEEAKNMFWTSLERTGLDYFDYYLLHNISEERIHAFDKFGIWEFVQEQKKAGLANYVGFSLHGNATFLKKVLDDHPEVDLVQVQINYADWESDLVESRKCYELLKARDIPFTIMEPCKGGLLANLPEKIAAVFLEANPNASIASWAYRFAASLPWGLITVLTGADSIEQIDDNTRVMSDFTSLDKSEYAVIAEVQSMLAEMPNVPCTNCRYCLEGCPQHIPIPGIFKALNDYLIYKDFCRAKRSYGFETMMKGDAASANAYNDLHKTGASIKREEDKGMIASKCIECGECESVCPQHIEIVKELKRASELFD